MAATFRLPLRRAARLQSFREGRSYNSSQATHRGASTEHDPANIVMHPVTGTFADPMHESAFAAQFFRLAFPCHAFLMVLMGACMAWIGPCLCPRSAWSVAAMLGLVTWSVACWCTAWTTRCAVSGLVRGPGHFSRC